MQPLATKGILAVVAAGEIVNQTGQARRLLSWGWPVCCQNTILTEVSKVHPDDWISSAGLMLDRIAQDDRTKLPSHAVA